MNSAGTILVADADRVACRAIQQALAPGFYEVEFVRDGEAAIEVLRRGDVSAIIADTMVGELSGAAFLQRIRSVLGPATPPCIFLSAEASATLRVKLLALGAADVLGKPFVGEELRVRLGNAIERWQGQVRPLAPGASALLADCEAISVPDVLTLLEFAAKSGIVEISTGGHSGQLTVESGRVIHARLGPLEGEDAFFAILRQRVGVLRFLSVVVSNGPRSLNARVSELLLESAVREDTERNILDASGQARPARPRAPSKPPAHPPPPDDRLPHARRMLMMMSDPLLLGDLVLGVDAERRIPTLRIELWTSLQVGVAAFLAIASPPGHDLVVSALQGRASHLRLLIELAGSILEVVLIDCEQAGLLPTGHGDAFIVAPPGGELLGIAPHRLGELQSRISQPHAAAIGIGGVSLRAGLAPKNDPEFFDFEESLDLRARLLDAVRLWIRRREGK